MEFARSGGRDARLLSAVVWSVGDEAILPAGSVLVDEKRSGRHCYVIVEGEVAVETPGRRRGTLGPNSYVGDVDPAGLPMAASGVTVRVQSPARVLVIDPARLAGRIQTDPALARAWQRWTAAAAVTALQPRPQTMPPNNPTL